MGGRFGDEIMFANPISYDIIIQFGGVRKPLTPPLPFPMALDLLAVSAVAQPFGVALS